MEGTRAAERGWTRVESRTDNATTTTPLERDLAELVVRVLQLETAPEAIDPRAPLFDAGLGLDSIDALEISLAISKTYGVALRSDDPRNAEIFGSLRGLADFVAANRTV